MEKKVTVNVINKSNNKLPNYATKGDAGCDIRIDFSRVTPENPIKVFGDAEVIFAGEAHSKTMIRLEPGARAILPTGIFTAIPEGWQVELRPRSGLSIKKGLNLINCVGTVDAGYINEWGLPIVNQGQETVWLEDGERVAQAVIMPVFHIDWNEVKTLSDSERGTGGFGSTGVK